MSVKKKKVHVEEKNVKKDGRGGGAMISLTVKEGLATRPSR